VARPDEETATDETSLPLLVVFLALRRGLCGEGAAMISEERGSQRATEPWA
jgi:hypothetical protein